MYVFGDGKHGKLGSTTYSNEFEACFVEKFRNYDVLQVVCGGCQTIVLAQKKSSESKKSSGSEEDIGSMLSIIPSFFNLFSRSQIPLFPSLNVRKVWHEVCEIKISLIVRRQLLIPWI